MFGDFERHIEHLAPATIEAYLTDLRAFDAWAREHNGEALSPETVTKSDVIAWRRYLARHYAPATANRRLAALRLYLSWGMEQGVIQANAADGVTNVPGEPLPPRWLSPKEMRALERAAERHGDPRDQAIITILLGTGMRVGELCSLRWSDVHISPRRGIINIFGGKGGRFRQIPLSAQLRDVFNGLPVEDDRVLPVTRWTVARTIKTLAGLAGIDAVSPHTLRHTFAKTLSDNGVPISTISKLLGHSSLDTTMVYLQPGEEDLIQAIETLA